MAALPFLPGPEVYFVFLKLFGLFWFFLCFGVSFLPKYKEQAAGGSVGSASSSVELRGGCGQAGSAQLIAVQPFPEAPVSSLLTPSPWLLRLLLPGRGNRGVCAVGGVGQPKGRGLWVRPGVLLRYRPRLTPWPCPSGRPRAGGSEVVGFWDLGGWREAVAHGRQWACVPFSYNATVNKS